MNTTYTVKHIQKGLFIMAPMYSFVAIRDIVFIPLFYRQCPVFGKRGANRNSLPLLIVSVIMAKLRPPFGENPAAVSRTVPIMVSYPDKETEGGS